MINVNIIQGKLGLALIELEGSYEPKLEWSNDSIRKWRSLLPMSNCGLLAEQVYAALLELTKINIPPQERFEYAELFRPLIQWISFNLRAFYLNKSDRLSEDDMLKANLEQSLKTLLTFVYKRVVEDINNDNLPGMHKGILPTTIYRIMHYYRLILLRCYQFYEELPKGMWKELNNLYLYAESVNALREKIIERDEMEDTRHNILSAYRKTLLLACMDLYQWRQDEQEMLKGVVFQWDPFTNLRVVAVSDKNKVGAFIIDLEKEFGPCPLVEYEDEFTPTCMVYDFKNMIPHLDKLISNLEKDEINIRLDNSLNSEYQIDLPTLRHLKRYWMSESVIKYEVFPFEGEVCLQLGGLAEICKQSHSNNFVIGTIVNEGNISIVTLKDQYHLPLQAGELFAIKNSSESDGSWKIGIIRWFKRVRNGDLVLGLENLGLSYQVVFIQTKRSGEVSDHFLKGVAFSKRDDLIPYRLATPIVPFKEGKEVNIKWSEDDKEVASYILETQIDATSHLRIFDLKLDKPVIPINFAIPTDKLIGSNTHSVTLHGELSVDNLNKLWEILE